ncbi:MAG: ATP-binding protein [Desulfobacteraceae bacterium]
MTLYHDTYRRLSYFPIAIGAVWFGLRGGIILAVLSCAAFIPHLLMYLPKGPQAYYSELSEIVFYLSAGIVIGFISSREKRLRENYRLLAEKLERSYKRLHEQTRQLMEAEENLGKSQKLSMLGRLSASLAHEIKNPLASLKGTTEIIADDIPEEHPKHEFVEIMRREISRLNNSVNDVLQYCRGLQEDRKLKKDTFGNIVGRVVSLVKNRAKGGTADFTVDIQAEMKVASVDEAGLTQVLMNILLNAADAVPENGTVEITGKIKKPDLYILSISDNGPGISQQEKKVIFTPFTTTRDEGTGLGLSISRKIIQSMGGEIKVRDSRFGGACFDLHIPVYESDLKNQEIAYDRFHTAD